MRELSSTVYVDKDLEPLMKDFLHARRSDCVVLQKAIETQNWEQVAQLGHKLSGVCGGYGFDEMGLLGEELEASSKSKNLESIRAVLKTMSEHLSVVQIIYR